MWVLRAPFESQRFSLSWTPRYGRTPLQARLQETRGNSTVADATRNNSLPAIPGLERPGYIHNAATRRRATIFSQLLTRRYRCSWPPEEFNPRHDTVSRAGRLCVED